MLIPALMLLAAQVPATDARLTNIPNTDTHFALPSYKTLAEWEKRKAKLRRQILFAAGLDPMPEKTPLHPQIFGRITIKDCTIEKVLLETMPGYYLGGNLYRPLEDTGKHPAVLNPHGHWAYGRLENQPLYSGPTLGANLARQGYVVFAWDMVGYNDTIQTPHAFGSDVEKLWGFGPFGLQLWNSIRAVDFIQSLEDVDTSRIAMTGASGGATQTFSLGAVDDRVSFFAPVNMISFSMQGGDYCENAPGLRLGTNNVEIAAMIAPKPLLMVSATGDWTKNTPTEEYPAIRRIYELYGKPENVETIQLDAPHNFNKENREAVYKFFAKRVLGAKDLSAYAEKTADIQQLGSMLALSGRAMPSNAVSYEQLFAEWKRRPTSPNLDTLRLALAAEWPEQVIDDGHALSRPNVGDRVPFVLQEGKGTPILVVGGSRQDITSGRPGMVIEVFRTRAHSAKHFESFNLSDDQLRVQDILTGLSWLHRRYAGPIELLAVGAAAGVQATYAAAIAPIDVSLKANTSEFHGTDQDFVKYFNVPDIQTAGGWVVVKR
jgi:dienelactone hydrolase